LAGRSLRRLAVIVTRVVVRVKAGRVGAAVAGVVARVVCDGDRVGLDAGQAKLDRRGAGQSPGLFAFLPQEGEGQVEALHFPQPALVRGSASTGLEIVLYLIEASHHLRIDGEHGATQARMLVLATGPVGPGAASQLDFALVEVLLEPEPLRFGDRPVLIGGPGLATTVDESLVVADDVFVEHCDVTPSCFKIQMPE